MGMRTSEESKKGMNFIEKSLSWIISIGGLVTSIIGLTKGSAFTESVVFVIIIIDSLILILLGIYVTISFYKNKSEIEEKEKELLNEKHNMEVLQGIYGEQTKAYLSLGTNCNYVIRTLHRFLNRLYDLTEQSLDGTDSIKDEENDMLNHGYSKEEIDNKTIAMAKEKDDKISNYLFDDYKRFLSNILSKTQDNIEKYLITKGYDLEVSITIKQLIEPSLQSSEKDFISKPYVYTAFRDSRTWTKKTRKEVAQRKYTIDKNSDFIHCLSQGFYIFNNKTTKSRDYCNENTEFDRYYNCGATTLICSVKENSEKYIYGFLACDVLYTKNDSDEIIDNVVAGFLEFAAYAISVYFDNIDYNWMFCQISDRYTTFWEMVYHKYLIAI